MSIPTSEGPSHIEDDGAPIDIPTVILPINFLKCSRSDLIVLISRMLVFLIQINDNNAKTDEDKNGPTEAKLTRFHSSTPPNISIYNYLIRLTKYSALESAVLLSSVYYIDLLSSIYPAFTLNSLTAHRYLLTATSVASKGLCDSFCTNAHYAKVGGVQCSELNILEEEFLRKVNYRVIPRDNNISLCEFEYQQNEFSITNPNVLPKDLQFSITQKNSGYNILDMYYRKMIQLIGSFSSSPDKSRKVDYKLEEIELNASNIPDDVSHNPVRDRTNRPPNKRSYDNSTENSNDKFLDESDQNNKTSLFNHNKKLATEEIKMQINERIK
ncbi:similar to Saccharomyces cerevisiae YOL001W PHO80 Cyclin, interacts with cyclin-dependent kinase Pho85p [Maudiozyma barnettii]|uniref:Similar to Saccharomyces cerevisiae YOL001W PHO80 Cyclin, interacts with cyclin-dependent kinase Pho85p n=1 Tax=Maudiozyma barnettii TaxID=61262 RepID=A0A8H2VI48_9SACH|nr:Pho80p [Kazachstania barnettii]CAB4255871.1 similar to Saccharomyces cerevisiae YOL001W PHO80 Cyclin, interacts with cyclin-dependent kinase Pho85p [Kazachstania barnettii]CAD1784431.1 similar to Saccharomyces cerevisiae YOL001W PHO80 Cyclin, interacts with cyclin-dependent kinase Pho85p [Kazachstania barnettii]